MQSRTTERRRLNVEDSARNGLNVEELQRRRIPGGPGGLPPGQGVENIAPDILVRGVRGACPLVRSLRTIALDYLVRLGLLKVLAPAWGSQGALPPSKKEGKLVGPFYVQSSTFSLLRSDFPRSVVHVQSFYLESLYVPLHHPSCRGRVVRGPVAVVPI